MHALRHRLIGVALLAFATACTRPDATPASERGESGFRGVLISPPRAKPDFALPDQNGRVYDFRKETEGKVALLFFGYTHCPDVCPLHVANVAAVLARMPFEEREAVRFVFVSTDPKRDTPQRLKEWLGNFDPSFIGLSAPEEEVNRILYELRMPPIQEDPKPTDSATYLVGHAAQVIAFGTDGVARVEYPFGVRQEDWAHDLPLLARGVVPDAEAANAAAPAGIELQAMAESAAAAAMRGMPIRVSVAIVPQPATTSEAALYVVLQNGGTTDDTLVTVWSELSARAEMHETMRGADGAAMAHMTPVPQVVVKAGETLRFAPGDRHVMLLQLSKRPEVGESIPIRLRFKGAGDIALAAEVVPYAEVERRLAPPAASGRP